MDITASRLRELRKSKQLSQEDVAKYLGITRTGYNKYESGDIKPVRKLNELAILFNVSVEYLLGREESTLESKVRDVPPHLILYHKNVSRLTGGSKPPADGIFY